MLTSVQSDETLAAVLRVLGDPLRLRIVSLLAREQLCTCPIVTETGARQPNVSNHLACLRDCGLVHARPRGRFVYYALADADVRLLLEQIDRVLRRTGPQIDACPRYRPAPAPSAGSRR